MPNKWMTHVSKVKKANPSLPYKSVLIKAGETYKKQKGKGIFDIARGALQNTDGKGGIYKVLDKIRNITKDPRVREIAKQFKK
jgi:hypothetical protein